MHSLNSLALRNLTAHPLRTILTALAITLGVAMVLAASIIGQAASQTAAQAVQAGPRAELEIFSRDGAPFDQSVLETLRARPEVEVASPSLRVEVKSLDPKIDHLTLLGVEAAAYQALYVPRLVSGAFLDRPETIVLPGALALEHNVRVGNEVTLSANRQEVKLTVAGRLETEQDWTAMSDAGLAYVPLEVAQTLRVLENPQGPARSVERVEIKLRPGANIEQTKSNLSSQLLSPLAVAKISASSASTATLPVVQVGLAVVGVMMLLAAAFVIMNAFAMSITGRMQEIGSLRALGMTRQQIMALVLTEAGVLGLAGAGLGVLLGLGLAWGVMYARGTLGRVPYAVPWWGAAVSVALGLAMTFLGALQPAWRASRISPLEALRTASKQEWGNWYTRYSGRVGSAWLLVLLVGLTAASLIFKPDFFGAFAFLAIALVGLLAGAALMMPALVRPMARLARLVLVRWLGTAGRLAADNLARNVQRTVLTTGALAVGLLTIIASSAFLTMTLKSGLNVYFGLFHEHGMVMPDIPKMLASDEIWVQLSNCEHGCSGHIANGGVVTSTRSEVVLDE